MSDLLTHWAIFEDCRRLASCLEKVSPELSKVLNEEREFARLGAVSRAGATFVPHVLNQERNKFKESGYDALNRRRLAFALGGILHYPADFVMKPLMSRLAKADWHKEHARMASGRREVDSRAREISAYYDSHVFRKVYLAGREDPFNRFLFADNSTEPGRALEEFVYSLFQRALLSSHTLAPDKANLDGWLDNLISRVQPLYIDIRAFVAVYLQPDPAKLREYGVETEFYLDSDPAIMAARKVQQGVSMGQAELSTALEIGANQSGYGKALCIGLASLVEASDYWAGRRSEPPDIRQG